MDVLLLMSPTRVCYYLFPRCPLLSRSIIASGVFFFSKTFCIFSLMVRRSEPVSYDVPLFTDMKPLPDLISFVSFVSLYSVYHSLTRDWSN